MSLTKEDSSDLSPSVFVRGSKFRKSFRIRHRFNAKLPPAALIFMKSLEKNKVLDKVSTFESVKSMSIFYTTTVEVKSQDDLRNASTTDDYDHSTEDDQMLIKKSPILRRRSSIKNLSGKKKLKMSKLINLFRK